MKIPPLPTCKIEEIKKIQNNDIKNNNTDNINNENNNIDSEIAEIYGMLQPKEIEKTDDKEQVVMENFFDVSKTTYDDFEEASWKKGEGYKIPSFPQIEKQLEGLESGFYLFAGESNSGKTAIMMNILKDICSYKDNNLFGVYYSLDDSKNEIIPRIIAMEQEIPISVASKPKRYKALIDNMDNDSASLYRDYLDKRQKGLEKLKSESNLFMIEDTVKIKNSTDLKNHMIKVQTFVKSINPKMNIIVGIDSFNDIALDKKEFGKVNKDDVTEISSKFVKDLTVDLDIIIFSSCHLRKVNGNRRPMLDDLRNANTLIYEASLIWLVFNDVSKNKSGAKISWNDTKAENNTGAIIELDWGKNKKSSYKGRTFYKFQPYYSKVVECKKDEADRYEALII